MIVSKKMKVISTAAIAIVTAVTIACANISNTKIGATSNSDNWQKKYPKVFSNAGYARLIESSVMKVHQLTESQQRSVSITNKLGIYDPVLKYLLTNVSNESMLYAAIRFAQVNEEIYLSETTESTIYFANQSFIPLHCMNYFSNNHAKSIYMPLAKIYKSNAFYSDRIARTESMLNLKILGIDKSKEELDKICDLGGY